MLIFVNHDDMRSLELMDECLKRGWYVSDQLKDMKYADVIYMGAKGVDRKNRLMMDNETIIVPENVLQKLKQGCWILTLIHNDYLQELSDSYGFHYKGLLDEENFVEKNSILTSEGVIAYLIMHRKYPIYQSRILVLGFGHCAKPIIRYLKVLGAYITVGVRNQKYKKNIEDMGCQYVCIDDINLQDIDILINTIPHVIVEKKQLNDAYKDIVMVDIASYPYGIDHHYALSIGLSSQILSSIPSKYAYGYAGKMIADEIERVIVNE